MSDLLVIRSKAQLWNDIVMEGLKNGQDLKAIKANLLEAMRKEIFDQMMWRLHVDDIREAPQTEKNEKIVENITKQAMLKWKSLIRECNMYKETLNLITEEDLATIWDVLEDDEDDGYEVGEAVDPEEDRVKNTVDNEEL